MEVISEHRLVWGRDVTGEPGEGSIESNEESIRGCKERFSKRNLKNIKTNIMEALSMG